MVKIIKNVKIEHEDAQLEPTLRSLLGRIPFVEVQAMQREVSVSSTSRDRADAVFNLSVGQRPWVRFSLCSRSVIARGSEQWRDRQNCRQYSIEKCCRVKPKYNRWI